MLIKAKNLRKIIRESLSDAWLPSVSPDQMVTVTEKPIKKIRDTSRLCEIAEKPAGIWYSPGEEWINYLKWEFEMLEEANYVYSLQPVYSQGGLESSGGVLHINSPVMLYEFHRRFGVPEDPERAAAYDALIGRARKLDPSIFTDVNWPAVAKIWDGIEISPHQAEVARDIQVQWYVGWDIASGCIWRPAGVQNIQLLATRNQSH